MINIRVYQVILVYNVHDPNTFTFSDLKITHQTGRYTTHGSIWHVEEVPNHESYLSYNSLLTMKFAMTIKVSRVARENIRANAVLHRWWNITLSSLFSARNWLAAPIPRVGEEETQIEEAGATSQFIFHGCKMPRLLQNHYGIQSRTEGGRMRGMLNNPLPAHRRSC